jgi:hypothetical protein
LHPSAANHNENKKDGDENFFPCQMHQMLKPLNTVLASFLSWQKTLHTSMT